MAILCIRVAANPGNAVLRTQPGDVMCIEEDGHVFSAAERNCGQYRFVRVPGVPASAFDALRTPVFAADGATMTRIRGQRIDPAAFGAGAWRTRTTATRAQVDSITIARS